MTSSYPTSDEQTVPESCCQYDAFACPDTSNEDDLEMVKPCADILEQDILVDLKVLSTVAGVVVVSSAFSAVLALINLMTF